jgi:hypothetical protein
MRRPRKWCPDCKHALHRKPCQELTNHYGLGFMACGCNQRSYRGRDSYRRRFVGR